MIFWRYSGKDVVFKENYLLTSFSIDYLALLYWSVIIVGDWSVFCPRSLSSF